MSYKRVMRSLSSTERERRKRVWSNRVCVKVRYGLLKRVCFPATAWWSKEPGECVMGKLSKRCPGRRRSLPKHNDDVGILRLPTHPGDCYFDCHADRRLCCPGVFAGVPVSKHHSARSSCLRDGSRGRCSHRSAVCCDADRTADQRCRWHELHVLAQLQYRADEVASEF